MQSLQKLLEAFLAFTVILTQFFSLSGSCALSISFRCVATPLSIVFLSVISAVGENPTTNTYTPLTRIKTTQPFNVHTAKLVTGNPFPLKGCQLCVHSFFCSMKQCNQKWKLQIAKKIRTTWRALNRNYNVSLFLVFT